MKAFEQNTLRMCNDFIKLKENELKKRKIKIKREIEELSF